MLRMYTVACMFLFFVATSTQAEPLTIRDYRGTVTEFPAGAISFADRIVATDPGQPQPIRDWRKLTSALHAPDYDGESPLALTLGCGGSVDLEFSDNALVNIPGPDLYVFEIGPAIEPTRLSVSNDLANWKEVGEIGGGRAEIDLSNYGIGTEEFRYVRLVDLKMECGGETPGADIDAVGAIGSAERIVLSGSTLFDFDSFSLRPEAHHRLKTLASDIDGQYVNRITIAGHTDSEGPHVYNERLGLQRAQAVADFLWALSPNLEDISLVESRGEHEPISTNETEEGRQENRRVEIIVVPE